MKPIVNYTIKEIADMAQVSRATVDRVIHGRGMVSEDAYAKIKLILDKIDYKPNLAARALRKGELLKIAVLIPDSNFDIYWKRAIDGIYSAVNEVSFMGVKVEMYLFNPFKEASFDVQAKQVLEEKYDGVLLAPVFYNQALSFFKACKDRALPFVTFNTNIKESEALCHVGQDLVKSGRTAASLLMKCLKEGDQYLIIHIDEDISNAKHMQEKAEGFVELIASKGVCKESVRVLKIEDTKFVEQRLLETLVQSPAVKGVFVSTSKVYHVAKVVESNKLDLTVVGYDLIGENIVGLNAEQIDFLIFQNPGLQASTAISSLIDHLVFKKALPTVKYLPIEIVTKENYQDYLT